LLNAPLAGHECAQLEEEPGGDDPVAGENRADRARARALRYVDDDFAVPRVGERLEQRQQEPHGSDRERQRQQRAHTRAGRLASALLARASGGAVCPQPVTAVLQQHVASPSGRWGERLERWRRNRRLDDV
jgi:hypothetical protein